MKFISFNYILFSVLTALTGTVSAQEKLSLAEAAALAIENNLELKATRIGNEISRQERNEARSLFLPTVSLSGQINHYFKRSPFFGFGSEVSQDKIPYGRFGGEDQLGAAVTAIQPLYNPIAGTTVKQAVLSGRQSELQEQLTRIEVTSLVRQTYLQILVLQERIKVEQESIRRNEHALRDARSLLLQGKALRVDTLRAYTAVKNLEPQISKLQYAVGSAKLHLQTLTGSRSADFVLTDSLHVQVPVLSFDEREVYDAALHDNPEFQLIRLHVERSKQDAAITAASKLPVLTAVGQYQVLSQTNDFRFGESYYPTASFVGIQLSVPLFTGLSLRARSQGARLKYGQSELRQEYAQEQLRARVHDVIARNQESLQRLQTAVSVSETARVSYGIIQYRYQKGIASRLELSDAELELSTARSNYLEAVYDYLSSGIEISKLMGKVD
jgi:outer membrane protein TolC